MPPGTCSRDEAQVNNNNKSKTKINSGTENKRKQTKKNIIEHSKSSYLRRFDSSREKLRLGYKTNFVQKVVTPYSLDY